MAQLDQIVGEILKDIVKARIDADEFSTQASKNYHSHPILRHFPVPRMDVKSVEMDIKFAVGNSTLSVEKRNEIFDKYADRFASELTNAFISKVKNEEEGNLEANKRLNDLFGYDATDDLRQNIIFYFKSNENAILDDEVLFDLKKVLGAVILPVRKMLTENSRTRGEFGLGDENYRSEVKAILNKLIKSIGIEMQTEFLSLLQNTKNLQTDMYVEAKELNELPPHLISTMKLVTDLKNYNWANANQEGESGESTPENDDLVPET